MQLALDSELASARDRCPAALLERDPDGAKLEAFGIGVIDAICRACRLDPHDDLLRLLAYIVMLRHWRGKPALERAERALDYAHDDELARFAARGRATAVKLVAGERGAGGGYAAELESPAKS